MRARLLLLFVVVFCVSNNAFSQLNSFLYKGKQVELSQKLIDHFGEEYISYLKTNNPNTLLYLNYFSENSYKIEDIGEKAASDNVKKISSLKKSAKSNAPDYNSNDLSTFNVLSYGVKLEQSTQAYVVNNGTKAVVVMSKKQFFDNYNNYRASFK